MITQLLLGTGLVLWYSNEMETRRQRLYLAAINIGMRSGKPILNIGCGQETKYIGNVNLDIKASILPNFVKASAYEIPYADKTFSVAYAFHVLEHLDNPQKALQEWNRVADFILIETPLITSPCAWLNAGHKWVIGQDKLIPINPGINWAILGGIGLLLLKE